MVEYNAIIKKFGSQGEKTGWTYIEVPAKYALRLKPGNKRTFRVKGFFDDYKVEGIALVPFGGGDFIIALNAAIRKAIRKTKDATIKVKIEIDTKEIEPCAELIECLKDELDRFIKLEELRGSEGLNALKVERYKRDATPASLLLLTFIGVVVASRKVRGGSGLHMAVGLITASIFILTDRFSTIFSTKGDLHPLLAAWLPNIIFTFVAYVFL